MKWYDIYAQTRIIGEFWKMFDKQQYKQRWGNGKKAH